MTIETEWARHRDIHLMPGDNFAVDWRPASGNDYIDLTDATGAQRVYLHGRKALVMSTIICPNPAAHRRRPSRARRIRRRLRALLHR